MGEFFLGCALGLLFVGCIAAPFVAPWRIRLRYLINAQVADPAFGVSPPRDIALREVKVTTVDACRGRVDLVFEEFGGARDSGRRALSRDGCAPAVVAKLDGWSATGVPLLMVVDEFGDTHLFGPDGAVTHLHRAEGHDRRG
jgi:hypothetical protein